MLSGYFDERPRKEALSAQPFVDHSRQCILVTGGAGFALELLRRHVGNGSRNGLEPVARTLDNYRQAKITQQDFILVSKQHIFWFDISMDEFLIMRIL